MRIEYPEVWSEDDIEQTITALRNHGHYNAPTAYYVADMLQQLLKERRSLITKAEIAEAQHAKRD